MKLIHDITRVGPLILCIDYQQSTSIFPTCFALYFKAIHLPWSLCSASFLAPSSTLFFFLELITCDTYSNVTAFTLRSLQFQGDNMVLNWYSDDCDMDKRIWDQWSRSFCWVGSKRRQPSAFPSWDTYFQS